jgi:LacI family repressor for deo operon, udp, cdd, tsx, nupC, and nupG
MNESSPPPLGGKPATIKDVAEAVGLSIATVSRALSNPSMLNATTLERVSKAIDELGYRPNLTARNLKTNETRLVMVVVPSLSPFFLELFRGAEQAARETGYSVLVGHTERDPDRERGFIDQVNSRRADGMVLVSSMDRAVLSKGAHRLPPIVIALDIGPDNDLPNVRVDHAAAAAEITSHLLALGHRRIAHIAGASVSPMTMHRLEGFQRALAAYGVAYDPQLCVQGAFTMESGEQAMDALLADTAAPTAVFAANDEMAVGAIRALRRAGLRVPQDVSVVGFDDQRIAALYEPPLSTVRIPTFDIGYLSMRKLTQILAGETVAEDTMLPCEMILRQSTLPLAGAAAPPTQ